LVDLITRRTSPGTVTMITVSMSTVTMSTVTMSTVTMNTLAVKSRHLRPGRPRVGPETLAARRSEVTFGHCVDVHLQDGFNRHEMMPLFDARCCPGSMIHGLQGFR
jgi:hypothetical protein